MSGYAQETKDKALALTNSGVTAAEAAKKLGVSEGTIYGWRSAAKRKTPKTIATQATVAFAPEPKNNTHTFSDAAVISVRDENTRLKIALANLYLKTIQ